MNSIPMVKFAQIKKAIITILIISPVLIMIIMRPMRIMNQWVYFGLLFLYLFVQISFSFAKADKKIDPNIIDYVRHRPYLFLRVLITVVAIVMSKIVESSSQTLIHSTWYIFVILLSIVTMFEVIKAKRENIKIERTPIFIALTLILFSVLRFWR